MDIAIKYFIMNKLKKNNINQIIIKNNNRINRNTKNNNLLFNKSDKKIKNKTKYNLLINNNFRLLLNIITIIIILSTCLSKNIELKKLTSIYEITIILKGTGNKNILSSSCPIDTENSKYEADPDEITINKFNIYYLIKNKNHN